MYSIFYRKQHSLTVLLYLQIWYNRLPLLWRMQRLDTTNISWNPNTIKRYFLLLPMCTQNTWQYSTEITWARKGHYNIRFKMNSPCDSLSQHLSFAHWHAVNKFYTPFSIMKNVVTIWLNVFRHYPAAYSIYLVLLPNCHRIQNPE